MRGGVKLHTVIYGTNTLQFDWPLLRIGTAEYAEGPTGATVFHFQRPVLAAVDRRFPGSWVCARIVHKAPCFHASKPETPKGA